MNRSSSTRHSRAAPLRWPPWKSKFFPSLFALRLCTDSSLSLRFCLARCLSLCLSAHPHAHINTHNRTHNAPQYLHPHTYTRTCTHLHSQTHFTQSHAHTHTHTHTQTHMHMHTYALSRRSHELNSTTKTVLVAALKSNLPK